MKQLKKLAAKTSKKEEEEEEEEEDWDAGILQQEDFERIKELKQRQLMKDVMRKYGLKEDSVAFSHTLEEAERILDQSKIVSDRKVDANELEYTKRYTKTKEERLQSVLA